MFSDYYGLQFRIERNKYEQGKLSYSCVGLRQEVDKSQNNLVSLMSRQSIVYIDYKYNIITLLSS